MLSILPTIQFGEVAHVGDLDRSSKRSGSYEGTCLSVSTCPAAWASIAKLGDNGFILSGRGRFVDALALTADNRDWITTWASAEGLLEIKEVTRLHFLDTETDEWRYSDFSTHEKADAETDEMEEDTFRLERLTVHVATSKLASASEHPENGVDSALSFDLALIEFARRDPSLDGVWWDEECDPAALSAPRGAIFPERIPDFLARPATWSDLADFEASNDAGFRIEAARNGVCLR